jgi:hypothetical protein
MIVQGTGDRLFACATLASHTEGTLRGGEPFEAAQQALHACTWAQPIAKPVPFLHGLASGPMFAPERIKAIEDSLSQYHGIQLTHCPV